MLVVLALGERLALGVLGGRFFLGGCKGRGGFNGSCG